MSVVERIHLRANRVSGEEREFLRSLIRELQLERVAVCELPTAFMLPIARLDDEDLVYQKGITNGAMVALNGVVRLVEDATPEKVVKFVSQFAERILKRQRRAYAEAQKAVQKRRERR